MWVMPATGVSVMSLRLGLGWLVRRRADLATAAHVAASDVAVLDLRLFAGVGGAPVRVSAVAVHQSPIAKRFAEPRHNGSRDANSGAVSPDDPFFGHDGQLDPLSVLANPDLRRRVAAHANDVAEGDFSPIGAHLGRRVVPIVQNGLVSWCEEEPAQCRADDEHSRGTGADDDPLAAKSSTRHTHPTMIACA